MITIEDLKNPNILKQKLGEIGISEELLSHPAFYNINNTITEVIRYHLDKNSLGNMIFEHDNSLTYKALTGSLVPIEFSIAKIDDNKFTYTFRVDDVLEIYETSLENGQLIIENKYRIIKEQEENKTLLSHSSRKKTYDISGLEIYDVLKEYEQVTIPGNKESNRNVIGTEGLVAREVSLERRYLDVVRLTKKEYGNVIYSQDELLLTGYGLRQLYVSPSIRPKSIIEPLTKDEIEKLIATETDPRFIEGLRRYSYGRDRYYYNYHEDPIYVNLEEQDLDSSMGSR